MASNTNAASNMAQLMQQLQQSNVGAAADFTRAPQGQQTPQGQPPMGPMQMSPQMLAAMNRRKNMGRNTGRAMGNPKGAFNALEKLTKKMSPAQKKQFSQGMGNIFGINPQGPGAKGRAQEAWNEMPDEEAMRTGGMPGGMLHQEQAGKKNLIARQRGGQASQRFFPGPGGYKKGKRAAGSQLQQLMAQMGFAGPEGGQAPQPPGTNPPMGPPRPPWPPMPPMGTPPQQPPGQPPMGPMPQPPPGQPPMGPIGPPRVTPGLPVGPMPQPPMGQPPIGMPQPPWAGGPLPQRGPLDAGNYGGLSGAPGYMGMGAQQPPIRVSNPGTFFGGQPPGQAPPYGSQQWAQQQPQQPPTLSQTVGAQQNPKGMGLQPTPSIFPGFR